MQEVPAALVERFDLQAPWEVQAAQEEARLQGFVYLDEAAPGILGTLGTPQRTTLPARWSPAMRPTELPCP